MKPVPEHLRHRRHPLIVADLAAIPLNPAEIASSPTGC